MNNEEKPYLIEENLVITRLYNPEYGDQRTCKCGHPYERHFDSYIEMDPCGCKYCVCDDFKEDTRSESNILEEPNYNPGKFHTYGGVNWEAWHNYIRSEVAMCNAYWRSLIKSYNK